MSVGAEGNGDVWDIAQFAWVGGAWPGSATAQWRTGSGNNVYGYSNPEFDELANTCDATVDDDERDACYNDLDRYVTTRQPDPDGLSILPITPKPQFYAVSVDALSGRPVSPDTNQGGPLVNVVDYQFAG